MKSQFRCSVVIPTGNCRRFSPEALGSVWMQAIKDLKILVVDNGSSHATGEWLAAEARSDGRIAPIRIDGNGPNATRNAMFCKAPAPLIAFLDANDFGRPSKRATQLTDHQRYAESGFSCADDRPYDAPAPLRGTCFNDWRPGYFEGASADCVPAPEAFMAAPALLQNANGFASACQSAER